MKIAAILPCYNVADHILPLLQQFGEEVSHIIIVDDACPQGSGKLVQEQCSDKRVEVLFNAENKGVGGAVKEGYKRGLALKCDILVKIDGDGQMNPAFIPHLIKPIRSGQADYSKGNRFYQPEDLASMPPKRLAANAALSFFTKLSTGYWRMFDPANGYTAIHAAVAKRLPLDKIDNRYFFETDMLFRLNTIRAVVRDVPMTAFYGNEKSGLQLRNVAYEFLHKSIRNSYRRILYNYFIRNFSLASLQLVLGKLALLFGLIMGIDIVWNSIGSDVPATAGTIMLCALPIIVGSQMVLSFLGYDIANQPQHPIHSALHHPALGDDKEIE